MTYIPSFRCSWLEMPMLQICGWQQEAVRSLIAEVVWRICGIMGGLAWVGHFCRAAVVRHFVTSGDISLLCFVENLFHVHFSLLSSPISLKGIELNGPDDASEAFVVKPTTDVLLDHC
jgi:hypothetical protein